MQSEICENSNNNSNVTRKSKRKPKIKFVSLKKINGKQKKQINHKNKTATNNKTKRTNVANKKKININEQMKQLSIMYLNARSIRNKMDELKIIVSEHKPDIIGVVETWLNDSVFDSEINIENYHLVRKDRKNDLKSKGGGIIMYIKNEIPFVNATTDYCSNVDHLWLKILCKNCKPINIGIFYKPPDSNDEHTKFLIENMSKFKTANTILIGDFNYSDINWKEHTSGALGKKFLNAIIKLSLQQCMKEKTRGKNILDLVFVYEKSLINKIENITPLGKSDHNILKVELNSIVKLPIKSIICYNYKKGNYKLLEKKLESIDWADLLERNLVNEFWYTLVKILTDFKQNHIPQFKKNVTNDLPWFNNALRKLIKKRNNLFKRFKKTGQSYFKAKYVCARNLVTKQIRAAKFKYENKMIKRSKNNRKTFFSYVSSKNRRTCSSKIGPLIDSEGKTVVNDLEVATLLNNFFATVFNKENIKEELNFISANSSLEIKLDNIKFTEKEVIKALGEFKPNKSPGIDKISTTYALQIKEIIAKPLTLLFNRLMEKNIVPTDWKEANITPIFKKGEKSNVENYRPVSLTVLFGKVMEKIIKEHIEKFILTAKLIKVSQHGFMKGRSCMSNLLLFQNSVINMIDEGSSVDIIYLDLQKAFDKVPHSILLQKIRGMGIEGKVSDWIENWLSHRKQRVVIGESFSDWADVYSGVPQGSILGPLLFTIFINDIDANLMNGLLKFADDSKLWGRVDTEEEIQKIQSDLDSLTVWAESNLMPFNVSKCKIMHVGKKNSRVEYKLMGSTISKTTEEKDLGVFFTDNFKPSLNCNKACKSANKMTGLIRRTITNKNIEGMMILYKTLVRPIIDYCIPVWRPFTKQDTEQIEKVQRRYTKMINGCKEITYENRLVKLGITCLQERHYRADMIQVYKILNDCTDTYPTDFLVLNARVGRTNSLKLYKKRCNLQITKNSFTHRVVNLWNNLPDRVILSTDLNDFKNKLDYHIRCAKGQT